MWTSSFWVISLRQPQPSPMAAAVTVACITHLSKHLSSTHPFFAKSQHHGLATHVCACRHPRKTLHAEEGAHIYTWGPRMQTPSHYGDKSCLSWLPICESRHGVVVQVKLLRQLPSPDGSAGCPRALSCGHDC